MAFQAMFLCNLGHGPWSSGSDFVNLQAAAEHLMSVVDDTWLQEVSARIAFDRGEPEFTITREEWLDSHAVARRTPFAKLKGWFAIRHSFGKLDADWSILEESINHFVSSPAFTAAAAEEADGHVEDPPQAAETWLTQASISNSCIATVHELAID